MLRKPLRIKSLLKSKVTRRSISARTNIYSQWKPIINKIIPLLNGARIDITYKKELEIIACAPIFDNNTNNNENQSHKHSNPQGSNSSYLLNLILAGTAILLTQEGEDQDQQNPGSAANNNTPIIITDSNEADNRGLILRLISSILYRIRFVARIFHVMLTFFPLVITAPIVYYFATRTKKNSSVNNESTDNGNDKSIIADCWYQYLGFALRNLGASWIKLGQWASTRPDIFSKEFIDYISPLCHEAPGHKFYYTQKAINQSFPTKNKSGSDVPDILSNIEKEYVASGAIAQVHFGHLKDGSPVAIKVLHPRISELIEMDLWLMSFAVKCIELFPRTKWLSLSDALIQFSHTMKLQADLRVEAHNLVRFDQNFRDFPNIVFPKVITASKSVLIETFEEGESIVKYMNLANQYQVHNDNFKSNDKQFMEARKKVKQDCKYLANLGFNAYLKMMLLDNFIHADLHPGNILVRPKKRQYEMQQEELELVFLDVGLVTECSPSDWEHFKLLYRAIVDGDGQRGAALMIKYARKHKIEKENQEKFTAEMGEVFSEVKGKKIWEISVGIFLAKVLSVVQKYQVQIEGNFATLCVGTAVLEGLGRQLDPALNLLEASVDTLNRSVLAEVTTTAEKADFFINKTLKKN